jgi:hypothetical protein
VFCCCTIALTISTVQSAGGDDPSASPTAAEVLSGLRSFYERTARPDGSFQAGIDPDYVGMSDSAYSDLAPVTYAATVHRTFGWRLPSEQETVAWLRGRQRAGGEFFNVAGTVDPDSAQGRTYNTTQGLVALRALGAAPLHDPLPVFEAILQGDYQTLPSFSTSFFPLAYLCAGQAIPERADRDIRALMVQDEDGYADDHIAATFHASHYYCLVGEPTPKARQMVERILRDQRPDGSWMCNLPSRDRHATFDAVFTLRHEGGDREDCRAAIDRAAQWALSCRNPDGGFGHFPGSTSDADAVYFHVGTLAMAGFLRPVDPLPADPHLLSWGHLMPVRERSSGAPLRLQHAGWVGAVAFGAEGRSLATGCSDGVLRTWSIDSGEPLREFAGHVAAVSAVALSADGALVASGSFDHTARLWDATTGECRHTLGDHRGAVMAVAFCDSDRLLATGSIDGKIRLWNTTDGTPARTLEGHRSWVNALAVAPDGRQLISGSSDGTLRVWSLPEGDLLHTLAATKAEVRSVAISPDGRLLAAGIRYGAIKVWDTRASEEIHSIAGHSGDVWGVTFLRGGQVLATGDGDWNRPGQVKLWNMSDGTLLEELRHTGEVLSLAASTDGTTLAAGGADGTVSVWRD